MVTEIETPGAISGQTVAQAGVPGWLVFGLLAGFVYMTYKKSKQEEQLEKLAKQYPIQRKL